MGFFASVIHRFHQQRLSDFLRDKNGSHLELNQRKELIWSGIMMNHGHRGLANHVHKEAHANTQCSTELNLWTGSATILTRISPRNSRHLWIGGFFWIFAFFSRIFAFFFLRICAFFAGKVRCFFHLRSPIRAKGAKSHICEKTFRARIAPREASAIRVLKCKANNFCQNDDLEKGIWKNNRCIAWPLHFPRKLGELRCFDVKLGDFHKISATTEVRETNLGVGCFRNVCFNSSSLERSLDISV